MKEQSHKEEMSAAIRGDFQRLRERGVSPALAPQDEEREPDDDPIADEPPHGPPGEAGSGRRSWLSRLSGR